MEACWRQVVCRSAEDRKDKAPKNVMGIARVAGAEIDIGRVRNLLSSEHRALPGTCKSNSYGSDLRVQDSQEASEKMPPRPVRSAASDRKGKPGVTSGCSEIGVESHEPTCPCPEMSR